MDIILLIMFKAIEPAFMRKRKIKLIDNDNILLAYLLQ